jgi:hypothetical protein
MSVSVSSNLVLAAVSKETFTDDSGRHEHGLLITFVVDGNIHVEDWHLPNLSKADLDSAVSFLREKRGQKIQSMISDLPNEIFLLFDCGAKWGVSTPSDGL